MEVHVAILLLVGAVALIGLLSGALKLHPLFVLIITALVVGVCSGSRSEDAISAVTKGFGACRLPISAAVYICMVLLSCVCSPMLRACRRHYWGCWRDHCRRGCDWHTHGSIGLFVITPARHTFTPLAAAGTVWRCQGYRKRHAARHQSHRSRPHYGMHTVITPPPPPFPSYHSHTLLASLQALLGLLISITVFADVGFIMYAHTHTRHSSTCWVSSSNLIDPCPQLQQFGAHHKAGGSSVRLLHAPGCAVPGTWAVCFPHHDPTHARPRPGCPNPASQPGRCHGSWLHGGALCCCLWHPLLAHRHAAALCPCSPWTPRPCISPPPLAPAARTSA